MELSKQQEKKIAMSASIEQYAKESEDYYKISITLLELQLIVSKEKYNHSYIYGDILKLHQYMYIRIPWHRYSFGPPRGKFID